ncbi:MAG: peptidoglycan DD-metalloendopeptidase family protein [Clostridiales bacterium]|nr:peptidoglycan DD-metalloendopeptidase family protein [Clostridiales bacterium]
MQNNEMMNAVTMDTATDKNTKARRKRKHNYTLMLFVDSREGRIRQMGIGPAVIESAAVAGLILVITLAVLCVVRGRSIETLETLNQEQADRIVELEEENEDLTALREELTDKVTILSDTINQKVEEEEALEEAVAQAHMPVGFPMSSSASLEEADTEDPMVKLNGTEGSSVIASGDGTVISITTDTSYLHCIKIDHGNGYISIYRNDGDAMVKEGDEVVRGAILYVIGEENTELGYQITYDERYMDPMELINIDG